MKYRIAFTRRAERDIAEILDWLSRHSLKGAATWLDRMESADASLSVIGDRCAFTPENRSGSNEVRQSIFSTRRGKPYRILFTICDGVVIIRHVRGPGQDLVPPDELCPPAE